MISAEAEATEPMLIRDQPTLDQCLLEPERPDPEFVDAFIRLPQRQVIGVHPAQIGKYRFIHFKGSALDAVDGLRRLLDCRR